MNLWAVHPQYLDKHGLLAIWRRGLQVQKILENDEEDNESYPESKVFRQTPQPLRAIGSYLSIVASEGARQGYSLNHEKIICPNFDENILPLDKKVLASEIDCLENRLQKRDLKKYMQLLEDKKVRTNPVFNLN